ncbi:MAG: SpoIIE family protein phosphatase [Victivallales bacterium]|nr:SpoIIE family protein phosphatase [Victivallales bacterium]
MMKSIRGKMLVRFGGVLSVLLILLGLVVYERTADTVMPLTRNLSIEVLAARSDEMAKLLDGYVRDVELISDDPAYFSGEEGKIIPAMSKGLGKLGNNDYEMLFFADTSGSFVTSCGEHGDVSDREYFVAVVKGNSAFHISTPVVSRASGKDVFVVAVPLKNDRGEISGMLGATVLLETLSGIAAKISVGKHGFGYVTSGDGTLIAHPNREWRLKLNLLDSARHGFSDLDKAGEKMIVGESGFAEYTRPDGEKYITVFHPIRNSGGWSLGIAFKQDEILGPARALVRTVALLMTAILAAVLVAVALLSASIAEPIQKLCICAQTIGQGTLDKPIVIRTGDEIEKLADSFNRMQIDLAVHIENLKRTTAEKERIEHDLAVANKIQNSMLPRTFPPFPNIDTLDLFATMQPAKEVGGDFYDFFMIDDRRLCFSIGDISDKGIGAALFMVITRTILKNQAMQGLPLQEIMARTNDMLCDENEESMFATVLMGTLDIRSGEILYACAGHNPPLIARNNDKYAFLKVDPCIVLGAFPKSSFTVLKTTIAPGDSLFLYTDGVSEAQNHKGELFGEKRMLDAANSCKNRSARNIIGTIRDAVDSFIEGNPPSDDITMLALGTIRPRK